MSEPRKLSVRLSPESAAKLEKLAAEQGLSLNAALQKAITTEDFLREQIDQGNKILIERPNKTFAEVLFR